jgi:dihydrofolate reductase
VIISLLVAMDERRGIGKAGGLPWRLSSDLKRFRNLTMGHHIIVGRKTFESIGRPLPGRQIIIVSRNEDYRAEGCLIARSVGDAIELARDRGEAEVFICGGAEIYARSLGAADRMYLTLVHADCGADTFFPDYDGGEWVELEREEHAADEKNEHPTTFKLLVKKAGLK